MDFDAFVIFPNANCAVDYIHIVSPAPSDPTMVTFTSEERTFTFMTSDLTQAGIYAAGVAGTVWGSAIAGAESVFTLTVKNPCQSGAILIDPNILTDNNIIIVLGEEPNVQTFSDSKITLDIGMLAQCPDVIFSVENRDGSAINQNIFTLDPGGETLSIESTSSLDLGTYDLTLKVSIVDLGYTNEETLDFTVEIIEVNVCDPPTSITALTIDDQIYTIGEDIIEYRIDAVVVDPTSC